jgi:hypothetical protein
MEYGAPIILAPTEVNSLDISFPYTQPTMVHSLVTIPQNEYIR